MCGFFIELSSGAGATSSHLKMRTHLEKRGPDSTNVVTGDNWAGEFYRLAIVSEVGVGEQPVQLGARRYLFFNGEIYNWKKLTPVGQNFSSDTELLAYLISVNGFARTLNHLEGMYAIAVYDEVNRNLQIARDYPGIKPLYYYNSGLRVLVSSDLNTIVDDVSTRLDPERASELLAFRHVLAPNTLYSGVYQCGPGTLVTFKLNGSNQFSHTCDQIYPIEDKFCFEKATTEGLRAEVEQSVILQSKSIHEPSTLLSSGIDSGLIALTLLKEYKELGAFSVYFDDAAYSERRDIEEDWLGKNIDINFFLDQYRDIDGALVEEYVRFKGGPVTVGNEISLVQLFRAIKQKTSVVLSGEGADELFLGYDRAVKNLKEWSDENLNPRVMINRFLANYYYIQRDDIAKVATLSEVFCVIEDKLLAIHTEFGWQKMYQYFFLTYHIPALLDRLDKTSMFQSVEARVPFLSQSVLEYALGHDLGDPLIKGSKGIIGKRLLRRIAVDIGGTKFGLRSKIGFPHPLFSGSSRSPLISGTSGWIHDQFNYFKRIQE
jgi:asparagine synthase (glutamine-hydrolysing)